MGNGCLQPLMPRSRLRWRSVVAIIEFYAVQNMQFTDKSVSFYPHRHVQMGNTNLFFAYRRALFIHGWHTLQKQLISQNFTPVKPWFCFCPVCGFSCCACCTAATAGLPDGFKVEPPAMPLRKRLWCGCIAPLGQIVNRMAVWCPRPLTNTCHSRFSVPETHSKRPYEPSREHMDCPTRESAWDMRTWYRSMCPLQAIGFPVLHNLSAEPTASWHTC